ncbi:hypothetical protein [Clostridium botulinum]|uniref:hypothetical protein n=1 Tax=Clostridium botulinum TaxID=1491 RepID=UPI001C9BAB29|nr:hypothetical protein [Clostridium botulinum]MBY6860779.1 hypothetical protein [Clostridium botulinum]MBY7043832.1 hypothetical protein [Clostridium botulinum]
MRKVQSFSVDDVEDKEVLELLNKLSSKGSKTNKSAYIVNLIKEDIKKEKKLFTDEQREEIKQIFMDLFKDHPEVALTKTENHEVFDPDVLDALGQFDIGGINND